MRSFFGKQLNGPFSCFFFFCLINGEMFHGNIAGEPLAEVGDLVSKETVCCVGRQSEVQKCSVLF